jgi:starch synthase
MRICFATSECVPYVKTGGLADVSGALPKALADLGCEVKVFMPLYGSIHTLDFDLQYAFELENIPVVIGDRTVHFNTWYGNLPGSDVDVYFIDYPPFYHRPKVYTDEADEADRFILLQHAAFSIMQRYNWSPDILHCHDWPTALMPVYLRTAYNWDELFRQTASLLTIHNIGYQGLFAPSAVYRAGLSYDQFMPGGPLEFNGTFSFLKAGLVYADGISTVSETYAHEIQTPAFGAGLDGLLRSRQGAVHGIINGIDTGDWDPATDPHIPHPYSADTLDEKAANKKALLKKFGMPYDANVPLLGIISRLTGQKGFELLQPILADLIQQHALQLIVLGSGEQRYEDFFRWAENAFPGRVGAYIGYSNELSHWIEAGADLFLMPSHYEPCGLNQMYSLRYGTVPVVRKTGGLADTVHDFHETGGQGNGFSFYDATPYALYTSIVRALELFHQKDTWRAIQQRGMAGDFSWNHSAEQYLRLYHHLKQ